MEAQNGKRLSLAGFVIDYLDFHEISTNCLILQTGDLRRSGIDTVLATGIFAIVGAVSLQHGGEVASRIAREKVIGRLATN